MNNRSRIAGTAGQDKTLSNAALPGWRHTRWLPLATSAVAVLALAIWVVSGWVGGGHSFDGERLRIAEVTRGDLIRDISADGRVIAEAHDGRIALLNREGGGLCVSLTLPL